LLFYRCAEVLVKKIEQDRELLESYAGTSPDVLMFESFVFYQYLMSELTSSRVCEGRLAGFI
jgi:hypothetical protein